MNHLLDRHFIEMSFLFSLKKKMSSAAVKMNEQGQTIEANGIYFQRKQHNSHEMSSLIKMSSSEYFIIIFYYLNLCTKNIFLNNIVPTIIIYEAIYFVSEHTLITL